MTAVTRGDATCWARGLEEVLERVVNRFGEVEPGRRARHICAAFWRRRSA